MTQYAETVERMLACDLAALHLALYMSATHWRYYGDGNESSGPPYTVHETRSQIDATIRDCLAGKKGSVIEHGLLRAEWVDDGTKNGTIELAIKIGEFTPRPFRPRALKGKLDT